jgi:hypothetical protein
MNPSHALKILCLTLILHPSLNATLMLESSLLGWFDSPKAEKKQNFSGLFFFLPSGWSCISEEQTKLLCRPQSSNNELIFEKIGLPSIDSLPLVRMLRKREWEKQTLIHYVEQTVSSNLGTHLGQAAQYYRLNNISSPVLIRAFDVVIGDNTCVSITSKCDVRDCPVLEKEVANLVSSFSRTAKN